VSSEGTNEASQTVQDCSRFDFTCVTEAVSVVIDDSNLLLAQIGFPRRLRLSSGAPVIPPGRPFSQTILTAEPVKGSGPADSRCNKDL
jgi:hypothetical protein